MKNLPQSIKSWHDKTRVKKPFWRRNRNTTGDDILQTLSKGENIDVLKSLVKKRLAKHAWFLITETLILNHLTDITNTEYVGYRLVAFCEKHQLHDILSFRFLLRNNRRLYPLTHEINDILSLEINDYAYRWQEQSPCEDTRDQCFGQLWTGMEKQYHERLGHAEYIKTTLSSIKPMPIGDQWTILRWLHKTWTLCTPDWKHWISINNLSVNMEDPYHPRSIRYQTDWKLAVRALYHLPSIHTTIAIDRLSVPIHPLILCFMPNLNHDGSIRAHDLPDYLRFLAFPRGKEGFEYFLKHLPFLNDHMIGFLVHDSIEEYNFLIHLCVGLISEAKDSYPDWVNGIIQGKPYNHMELQQHCSYWIPPYEYAIYMLDAIKITRAADMEMNCHTLHNISTSYGIRAMEELPEDYGFAY